MTRFVDDPLSPLELFLRDYVEARDGVWDEIEPKVYDLLIDSDMIEVSFDPEALPEHPRAQLASLGSPLFDRLISDAVGRWSSAHLYRIGLNLEPYDLESRIRRGISFPPGVTAGIERVRGMSFPQAIFWFKATFSSDQKEDEVMRIGVDLHYRREVRHLDALLAFDRLSEIPERPLAEAAHDSLMEGYRTARSRVMRSVTPLANSRRRDWSGAVEKQIARMASYYAQLRQEAAEQATRATDPALAEARAKARVEAIDREEAVRVAELKRKSALRVEVKLSNLMTIQQPKLLVFLSVAVNSRLTQPLEVVWDPLLDSVEPVPCPRCGHPTTAFEADRAGLKCSSCPG